MKHNTLLVLVLPLATLAVSGAWAQETPGVTAPESTRGAVIKGKAPVAKKLLRVTFPKPKPYTLPNGLRILVLEDHRTPMIRYNLILKAGTLFEEKPGTSNMAASMLDQGTEHRSADQLSEELDAKGLQFSGATGLETASLSISGLSEFAEESADILADLLLHPVYPQDRLNRPQRGGFGGFRGGRRGPGGPGGGPATVVNRLFYGDTPYGRSATPARGAGGPGAPADPDPSGTTSANSQRPTHDDLAAFHEKFYRPNGAILAVTGDVKASDVVKTWTAKLAEWKPGTGEPVLPKAEFHAPEKTRIYVVDRPAAQQTQLQFANLAISRTDPDYVALQVANNILGGGASGRLFQNLREDKGFTYGAYSTVTTPRWTGLWNATASVRTPVTEPAVREFLREFQRIQDEPVTASELVRAKRAIIGSWARTLESADGILQRELELVQNGLPESYWDTYPTRVEAVTAADVRRVAQKYLGKGRIQLVAVGVRKEIEEPLKKLAPVEVVDSNGRPVKEATPAVSTPPSSPPAPKPGSETRQ